MASTFSGRNLQAQIDCPRGAQLDTLHCESLFAERDVRNCIVLISYILISKDSSFSSIIALRIVVSLLCSLGRDRRASKLG